MNGVFKVALNGEAGPRRPLPGALQALHEENFWASISLSGMQKYALFFIFPAGVLYEIHQNCSRRTFVGLTFHRTCGTLKTQIKKAFMTDG